jgi:hypothetical protein
MASRDGDSHKSRARQFVEEKRRQAKEEADRRAQAALDRQERADKRGQPKGEKEKGKREETPLPFRSPASGGNPVKIPGLSPRAGYHGHPRSRPRSGSKEATGREAHPHLRVGPA